MHTGVCTGADEIRGGVFLIRKKGLLVSQIGPPLELSNSNWIRLGLGTLGTERATERAGKVPGQHRPDMPT